MTGEIIIEIGKEKFYFFGTDIEVNRFVEHIKLDLNLKLKEPSKHKAILIDQIEYIGPRDHGKKYPVLTLKGNAKITDYRKGAQNVRG